MTDVYDVSEFDELASTIPAERLANLKTHGDAVVVAKRYCSDDASRTEVDELAAAIERRVRCRTPTK
jgi:hypothetical protein